MSNSLKKNYIFNTSYQILVLITPFITTPHLARVLGADLIGVESFVSSIASYFTMFAGLGISSYVGRQIAYDRDDRYKISVCIIETRILQLILSLVFLIFYLLYISNQNNYKDVFILYVIPIISLNFNFDFLFYALENFKLLFIRNIFFRFADVVFILFFVKSRSDLFLYIFGKLLITFLSYVSLWPNVAKKIEFVKISDLKIFRNFDIILELFVPTIAIQIYHTIDKIMIGLITNDNYQNGYYELAIKIPKIVLTLIVSLCTVMTPRIANYFKVGKNNEINKYMINSFNFVWMLSVPMALGVFAISNNFVPWFFGNGYDEIIGLLRVLSFLILPMGLSTIMGVPYLIAVGKQKLFNISIIFGLVVNVILNSMLIVKYGAYGAAIASLIAESLITILQFFMIRNCFNIFEILSLSKNYMLSGIIMFLIVSRISINLYPSIINSTILLVVGIFSYSITLFVINDNYFKKNMNIFICKINSFIKHK